jgi:4-hydroxyphenylacetate 3-monooxygenase
MTSKTGADHLKSLKDGREVWLDGKRVADVTTAPAFRNAVHAAAYLYDFQSNPKNLDSMTYAPEDKPGLRVNRAWQMPKSQDEIVTRRKAMESWAGTHFGFMGRSPDHVASCMAGMMMGIDVFEQYDARRAKALRNYYHYARDNDLYLTYAIINPQADRSKAANAQSDPFLALGVVDEDSTGITVRGAKMLATGAVMANEILVACIQPLVEDDKKHAVTFSIPLATQGLKILSRKSYEAGAKSEFDNPLSHRFDENDAIVYFDDVKVPWDRVFVSQDVGMSARQWHATPSHVLQNYQCQVRLTVKLRFLMGVARKIAEVNGTIGFPGVRETLGQLAAEAGMVEAMVYGMESKGQIEKGYFVPDRHFLYSAQVLTQQLYAKIINSLRELAGGGVIMLPSSAQDFENPALHNIIRKTQKSPAVESDDRVKFFKLAWDAIGSEFASRHSQYEMFYAGAPFVPRGHSFRTYDWAAATGAVEALMNSYGLEQSSTDTTLALAAIS